MIREDYALLDIHTDALVSEMFDYLRAHGIPDDYMINMTTELFHITYKLKAAYQYIEFFEEAVTEALGEEEMLKMRKKLESIMRDGYDPKNHWGRRKKRIKKKDQENIINFPH